MLTIKNLSLYVLKDLRSLLEGFSFSLEKGDKVAIIGEEGNGKSTLLKGIYCKKELENYVEVKGEIAKDKEVLGYLPQEFRKEDLKRSTEEIFQREIPFADMDYSLFYQLLGQMELKESCIGDVVFGNLSGGEKIKFYLLLELLKNPTVLLLDEPTNDLDLESILWLENFIKKSRIPVLFVSHDETLLENCATRMIHLEQPAGKTKTRHTISGLGYREYLENREDIIQRRKKLAIKEKQQYDQKMERYRQIYQRVQHELRSVSRGAPAVAKNLKDKMHSVKATGRRFEKEKEQMTKALQVEESIVFKFHKEDLPQGREFLNFSLEELKAGGRILSKDLRLYIKGSEKICIIGPNGSGKTTLLKEIEKELKKNKVHYSYMPQNYHEAMDMRLSPVEFLAGEGSKEEITKARTYLGSMNFTAEEMVKPIGDLSGGQKAKLYYLQMIYEKADVLLLDEPTRNVSPLSAYEVREAFRNYPGAIISVSHDRKFIREVCESVYRISEQGLELVEEV